MDTGTVPCAWKEAFISPLFKKGSKLVERNYRPVSITSIPCKILEKIVKNRIYDFKDSQNLFCVQQHDFVKHKSSKNLLEIMDTITKALKQKNSIDVIYLDFAKAFDTVPHMRILKKLEGYGISG